MDRLWVSRCVLLFLWTCPAAIMSRLSKEAMVTWFSFPAIVICLRCSQLNPTARNSCIFPLLPAMLNSQLCINFTLGANTGKSKYISKESSRCCVGGMFFFFLRIVLNSETNVYFPPDQVLALLHSFPCVRVLLYAWRTSHWLSFGNFSVVGQVGAVSSF